MNRSRLQLKGERILLRRHKISDVAQLVENIKDKDIVRWTTNIPYPYSETDALQFIRKARYKFKNKQAFDFAIALKDGDELIGGAGLNLIGKDKKQAELGYWLGKKYWGQGYVTEAVDLILHFGFNSLKLHRIQARCFKANKGSERVMIKAGFKKEGEIRECIYRYGKWHNMLRYSILRSEYRK